MDNLEKQIQEFWEKDSSPEQRRAILRQLEASGMEWKDFLQQYYNKVLAGDQPGGLSDEQKTRVWQRLQEQHLSEPGETGIAASQPIRPLRWLPWLAAASIISIIVLTLFRPANKPAAPAAIAQRPAAPTTIDHKNTARKEENLTLPDHSLVLLAPGSSIHYQQFFESHTRNIQLEGRALFDVAKDSARPFTVTAKGYATTALGTRFIVDATKDIISIRLLKGKIMVNATKDATMTLPKMILTPGQQLAINTITNRFNRLDNNQPNARPAGINTVATTLSFDRTSLANVFTRLSIYYKTPILYDKAAIQGLSFTGDLKSSDELDLALKVICNMNQLSFTKEGDRIRISKQQ